MAERKILQKRLKIAEHLWGYVDFLRGRNLTTEQIDNIIKQIHEQVKKGVWEPPTEQNTGIGKP
ncbi:MAG: hypothetical protein Q4D98_12525, partial [Planctomycetia bacterium]|nr:hypothetical protein [Planctomycetia bacterium]